MWKISIEYMACDTLKQQYLISSSSQKLVTSIKYYKFFAFVLLKGEVLRSLGEFRKYFKEGPEIVLDDTSMAPKVTRLLGSLQKFDIDSK